MGSKQRFSSDSALKRDPSFLFSPLSFFPRISSPFPSFSKTLSTSSRKYLIPRPNTHYISTMTSELFIPTVSFFRCMAMKRAKNQFCELFKRWHFLLFLAIIFCHPGFLKVQEEDVDAPAARIEHLLCRRRAKFFSVGIFSCFGVARRLLHLLLCLLVQKS